MNNKNHCCDDDRFPECGEEYYDPYKGPRCICKDPMMICIQPGKHIHIQCPVHGDVKIYGPKVHWLQAHPNGADTKSRWYTKFGEPSKSMHLTASMGPN